MSETEPNLSQLLAELTRSLQSLQEELEPTERRLRPPTPSELARFTSDVTIPAVVLVLETNIRALQLVQRALRMATDSDSPDASAPSRTRAQAVKLGQATLSRLDDTLTELQNTLDGRPPEEEARKLLQRIRTIEDEIEAELEATNQQTSADEADSRVDIDVDAELQSLRDEVDGDDDNS
jgi:flagellar motility protein MotE (MotC chaperone)